MDKLTIILMTQIAEADHVTDWIQLTPCGTFTGADGRGPFVIEDMQAVINASAGKKLAIDINHSTDIKGPKGEEAPAVGWIVELAARNDGIYGRVEWTSRGLEIMQAKEYGFISPVLIVSKGKPHKVEMIARASLCNDPNLTELKSLHTQNGETAMDKELRAALGLPETADEKAVMEAIKSLNTKAQAHDDVLAKLQEASGEKAETKPEAMIASLQSRGSDDADKTEMEKQLMAVNNELAAFKQTIAREKAEAFVNAAIKNGKMLPTLKEHFIARHMKEPEAVEKEIAAAVSLNAGGLDGYEASAHTGGLSASDKKIVELMGVDEQAFAEARKKEVL